VFVRPVPRVGCFAALKTYMSLGDLWGTGALGKEEAGRSAQRMRPDALSGRDNIGPGSRSETIESDIDGSATEALRAHDTHECGPFRRSGKQD